MVLWSENSKVAEYSDAIALEFKYFRCDEVPSGAPETGFTYDWTPVHRFLEEAAARRHHGVIRFRDADPDFSNPSAYSTPFLGSSLRHTPWSISIDAADDEYSPFAGQPEKKSLSFGFFDDSFLSAGPHGQKEANSAFFGKHAGSPNGGAISNYTVEDQKNALAASGPHGVPLAAAARTRGLTYLIGNEQTEYRTVSEIAAAGKSMGYRFAIRRRRSPGPRIARFAGADRSGPHGMLTLQDLKRALAAELIEENPKSLVSLGEEELIGLFQ